MQSLKPADIEWGKQDGLPYSRLFDDIYFSRDGGEEESEAVFLQGNGLPERWATAEGDFFSIGELGLGTALNVLVAWRAWQQARRDGRVHSQLKLRIGSVEKHPLTLEDLRKAHALWPGFEDLSEQLVRQYPLLISGVHVLEFPEDHLRLEWYWGDVSWALRECFADIDAWFLDGFGPKCNEQMWSDSVYAQMAQVSAPEASVATYSVAGHVRRGLRQAGFEVAKVPGCGSKKQVLRGRLVSPSVIERAARATGLATPCRDQRVAVIGAGMAGAASAAALAETGCLVDVFERHQPASAASGNKAALVSPVLQRGHNPVGEWYTQGWLHLLATAGDWYHQTGVLKLAEGESQAASLRQLIEEGGWDASVCRWQSADEISAELQAPCRQPGLWIPGAGYVEPQSWIASMLEHPRVSLHPGVEIKELRRSRDAGWLIEGRCFDHVVLCCPDSLPALLPAEAHSTLQLQPLAGQQCLLERAQVPTLPYAMSGAFGLVMGTDYCQLGSSYRVGLTDVSWSDAEAQAMQQRLAAILGPHWGEDQVTVVGGRAAVRYASMDHLPIVGPVLASEGNEAIRQRVEKGQAYELADLCYEPGLWLNTGHGSRGVIGASYGAAWLACRMREAAAPGPRCHMDYVAPGRFWLRLWKRGDSER